MYNHSPDIILLHLFATKLSYFISFSSKRILHLITDLKSQLEIAITSHIKAKLLIHFGGAWPTMLHMLMKAVQLTVLQKTAQIFPVPSKRTQPPSMLASKLKMDSQLKTKCVCTKRIEDSRPKNDICPELFSSLIAD